MNESFIDERDLIIISALQDAPRASWAELSPVLDMSHETLAERWTRLQSRGLAWVSLVDQQRIVERAQSFVLLKSRVGHSREVLNRFLDEPTIKTVHRIGGSFNLSLLMETEYPGEAESILSDIVGDSEHLIEMQVLPAYGLIVTGAEWRTAALSPRERDKLATIRRRSQSDLPKHATPGWAKKDKIASALIEELRHDGRMSAARLARRLKTEHSITTSLSTVSRKVAKILSTPGALIRCDISAADLGWHAVVMIWGDLSADQAARLWAERATASATAHHMVPEIRSVLLLAGSFNFHATLWLHTLDSLPQAEARLAQWLPSLEVKERSVVFSTPKRMGFVLSRGRRLVQ